jgi:hypothetical protein
MRGRRMSSSLIGKRSSGAVRRRVWAMRQPWDGTRLCQGAARLVLNRGPRL